MKILLAEDHAQMRAKLKRYLELKGHQVVEARDGKEAFTLITNGDERFDAIITDNSMPGMNGTNLLQAIGSNAHCPPTLLHSAEKRGYMDTGNGREQVDLHEFVSYFDFARFALKSGNPVEYIGDFLDSIST